MKIDRLVSVIRCDIELQARNGLYAATGFVLLVSLWALVALPPAGLARLLPAVALNSLGVTGFYFSAALALLERAEGSDRARFVTPLHPAEYLAARATTLALLGLQQQLALGLLLLGPSPALLTLCAGVILAAAMLALAGYAATAGRHTIGDFLLPSLPWLALLLAPLVADLLAWRSPLLWLHPLQGPLALMRSAVAPAAPWEPVLGLCAGMAWTTICFALARRVYGRSEGEPHACSALVPRPWRP
jgi:fluoroquinolone transport system permease protein